MENTKDLLDIINSIVEPGQRDAAVYTRDKRLFIVVKSPTLSHPLQYYDNDEPYTATYHSATQEWIDSLDVVCVTHCSIEDGYPTVAFGSIASIPTFRPDEIGSLKSKARSRIQRLAEKSATIAPLTSNRARAPKEPPKRAHLSLSSQRYGDSLVDVNQIRRKHWCIKPSRGWISPSRSSCIATLL